MSKDERKEMIENIAERFTQMDDVDKSYIAGYMAGKQEEGKATGDGRINRGKGSDEGSGTRSSLMWETRFILIRHFFLMSTKYLRI